MEGIIKLLQWLTNNWASVVTIIILIIGLVARTRKFITDWNSKTIEEKEKAEKEAFDKAVAYALGALNDYILILVSKAEIDWKSQEGKLGQTKRAQVIKEIYEKYPVLEQVEDKNDLLRYIDDLIDKSLEIVREELRKKSSENLIEE